MVIYRDNGATKRQQRTTANDPGLFVEITYCGSKLQPGNLNRDEALSADKPRLRGFFVWRAAQRRSVSACPPEQRTLSHVPPPGA
jgi:hypothetical protein